MNDIVSKIINQKDNIETKVLCKFVKNSMAKNKHAEYVKKVKKMIKEGLIFQCEVGFKSFYTIDGDTTKIYKQLRKINPSPHMYFVKFNDQKIIGASPELLFRLRNGEMETFPLAGTTKRGTNKEDIKLSRFAERSKEIAEHNMLVDLHRNDLVKLPSLELLK